MRKVKNLKGYIIGGLIGATLMFSAQGFAEDGLQTISALLRTGLSVTLNGKSVTLDNPSINYNGSTYIKLRDISKITGMGVNWNDATQTVELSGVSGNVYGNGNGTSVSGSVYGTSVGGTTVPTVSSVSPFPAPTNTTSTTDISTNNVLNLSNNDQIEIMSNYLSNSSVPAIKFQDKIYLPLRGGADKYKIDTNNIEFDNGTIKIKGKSNITLKNKVIHYNALSYISEEDFNTIANSQ